ncbi:hypothetical protein TCAL_10650 [Tigriopus californicus]|uniref:Uncharacterized protein n=1 Tax=Tigriopus californicus TaxID=6832 RepID=A0A553PMF5_TIGCA|nr:hypothetical protein TCAL_10650 [Tigriopus californicus]
MDGVNHDVFLGSFQGVRASTVDACEHHNPCKHGGICISTDGGPLCECRYIDFEGVFCEQSKDPPEATFKGDEYLSYDLVQLGGQPILSTQDEISLHFKTTRPDGLLFHTGNGKDYLNLSLQDGKVALTINLGSGRLDTGIKPRDIKFNDDKWHHVLIVRAAKEVNMTVDNTFTEKWTTTGTFTMLESAKVFIGGSEAPYKLPGTGNKNNFVGCLKKVEFRADSIHLPLLKLAKDGNGLMNAVGKIAFQCSSSQSILPIAFTSSDSNLILPTWNNTESGSLSFKFRTTEPTGLMFFNGGGVIGKGDFFAMEMMEGYLYKHIDLGSGAVKLRASNRRLDDGAWHKVEILRNQRSGTITVDEELHSFETPGEAFKLELDGPLYVGGLDPSLEPYRVPPVLWTASLRKGYVGCLRDLDINGYTVDIAQFASQQDSGSIESSCHIMPPKCPQKPCLQGGTCIEGWNRYICDCSMTSFTGSTCGKPAATIHLNGHQHLSINDLGRGVSEAEEIAFRFQTKLSHAFLLATRHDSSTDRLELSLESGRLQLSVTMGMTAKTVIVGDSLNDDIWHTVMMKRMGMIITLGVDDDTPLVAEIYGSESFLDYSRLHVGAIYPSHVIPSTAPNFIGHIQQLSFNGIPYLEHILSGLYHDHVLSGTFGRKRGMLYHTISFASNNTYLILPQMKAYNEVNIYFQFRTLEPDGLIMYNAGKGKDFLAIEMVGGHVHYVFNLGHDTVVLRDTSAKALNDNLWHSVFIGRPSRTKHTLLIDDNQLATMTTDGRDIHLDLQGILFLGGVRDTMYGKLPREVEANKGYHGCLASLDLNGEATDPLNNALRTSDLVNEGCEGDNLGHPPPSNLIRSSPASLTRAGGGFGALPGSCRKDFCANNGVCKNHWLTPECDCDLTSFTGPNCADESVAYEWGSKQGLIRYYYHMDHRPDTRADVLSLGFITPLRDCVVIRVDSDAANDYIELEIVGGNIFVGYNLGTEDFAIGDLSVRVDDGKYHVIRFTRSGPNSTLQIDDNQIQAKYPYGRQLSVFNGQSQIQLGGKWNPTLSRVERPFRGVMAGLVYNGLRPLDLASKGDGRTKVQGDVRLLDIIPFDYRERNRRLFDDHKMQQTNPSNRPEPGVNDELVYGRSRCTGDDDMYYDPKCFSFDGSVGDELITPVYITPTRPPWREPKQPYNPYRPCDDDDDDCGSGFEDSEQAYTRAPSYILTTTASTTEDWLHWQSTTEAPKPLTKAPIISTSKPQIIYENYDTKYNVYDNEPEIKDPPPQNNHVSAATAPSTILVIGIIVFAMIAIVLIVVIVLKTRTSADGNFKVEEARTYHFAPPADEFTPTVNTLPAGSTIIPTSATVIRTSATTVGDSNGFYGNGNTATVKKNNGKPIREWYV